MNYVNEILNNNAIRAMEAFGKSLPFVDQQDANKVDFAQVKLKVEHYFSLGIYARMLYIPKNTIAVGELHKYPQLNILVQGEISVSVDNEIKRLKAPFVVSSPAGTKRIAYTHEDTVWITVHGTHETDLNKIEQHFIAKSEEDYLAFIAEQEKQLCLTL